LNKIQAVNRNLTFKKQVTHNRLLYFGNINGRCFVIISENQSEADNIFCHWRVVKGGVGDLVAIIEPDAITRDMYDLPVVQTHKLIIPLKFKAVVQDFAFPKMAGTMNWFFHQKMTIKLSKLQVVQASCNGRLCDRQQDTNGHCGCLYTETKDGIVLSMNIIVREDDDSEPIMIVEGFRSIRTTYLFLKDITRSMSAADFSDYAIERSLRKKVYDGFQHVNVHGGWNIGGWIRLGTKEDASTPSEMILSNDARPHVSYLQPSNNSTRLSQFLEQN